MQQKIRQYLNKTYLGWVIIDSLPRARIISFMKRLNIQYKGIRVESLPFQQLAYDLAADAFESVGIMEELIKVLDEENYAVAEMMSAADAGQAWAMISDFDNLLYSSRAGKMLWALVSDGRRAINELAPRLTAGVERLMDSEDPGNTLIKTKKRGVVVSSLFKKEIQRLLRRISLLERNMVFCRQARGALERENKHLTEKNAAQQSAIIDLRRVCGEFTKEKGIWNKQAGKNESEILRLSQQYVELKKEMAVGPKMRLKAAIHHLQKENDKLVYVLENERRQMNEKAGILEKELSRLRQDITDAGQNNAELSARLEAEKERYAALQKEYQPVLIKKEHSVPKEKGRRLGIFIDNQNVFYSSRMHFGGKLDFQKFLPVLVKDRHLVKAICYIVRQPEGGQDNFIAMLKNNGYMVRMRDLIRRADGSAKGNWDIGIAADVITMVEKNSLDVVILVTCDGDFVDLVKLLSAKGVRVEVVGFSMNMAMDLKAAADEYYFITEDLMRKSDNAAG